MMLMQLLGKEDDEVVEDPEYLTGRWQAYVDAFVSVGSLCLSVVSVRKGELIVLRRARLRRLWTRPE